MCFILPFLVSPSAVLVRLMFVSAGNFQWQEQVESIPHFDGGPNSALRSISFCFILGSKPLRLLRSG